MWKLNIFSKNEIYQLHQSSLEILEQIGVQLDHEESLKLLDKAGASVDYKRRIVKIPENIILEALRSVKKKFTIKARDPKFDVEVGSGKLRCSMGSQLYIIDPFSRSRRDGSTKDIIRGCILGDALENIAIVAPIVVPQDKPLEVREVVSYHVGVKHTSKPLSIYLTQLMSAFHIVKLASIVAGGLDNLVKSKSLWYLANSITPLKYSYDTLAIVHYFAKLGLPIAFNSMPQAGMTGPMTLAGCIALGNAEILAGITLAFQINKELPILYINTPHVTDMRFGNISFGSPEQAILCIGAIQLAHFYDFPATVNAGLTDANIPDAQTGFEKALSAVLAILAGAEGIGAQGIVGADQGASLEQLVIDDEFISAILRVRKGFEISPEELALEVIKDVGVGGLFLMHRHTLTHARKVLWMPKVFNRLNWGQWIKRGGKDLLLRARERVEEILKEHQPQPLDRDIEKELDKAAEKVCKEILTKTGAKKD